MDDPSGPVKTLYVGNLDAGVTEELLFMLFSQFGTCLECKILREVGHDPYAFIKYGEHSSAQAALMAMNKRNVLNRELKVNWASHPGNMAKQDTSSHFHIYVGDLSPDIDATQVKNAFIPFGDISDCKIIRDPHTQVSKGYAFVCFVKKDDAENAIVTMNGQWLGGRTIKTNWASGKGNMITLAKNNTGRPLLDYDDVFNQSSDTNTTIYMAGVQTGLTEELLRETFGNYGSIMDVRIFREKCYAFIRMDKKESACRGIVSVHGTDVNGYVVKCSWGKDPTDITPSPNKPPSLTPSLTPNHPPNSASGPGFNPYMPQMPYWQYGMYQGQQQQQQYPQQQPPPPFQQQQPIYNNYGNQWGNGPNNGTGDGYQ